MFEENKQKEYFEIAPNHVDVYKVNADFPFDLNNLFSLNYSFETLKQAIEFLAKQQRNLANQVNYLSEKDAMGKPLSPV